VDAAAVQVLADGQGVAAWTWPLTPALTADELAAIQREAHTWLVANIAAAASPYGWSDCSVLVALAGYDGRQRSLLWQRTLPPFPKAQRDQALAQADTQRAALPLAAFPMARAPPVPACHAAPVCQPIAGDTDPCYTQHARWES
jgi:hypothetical protein